MTGRAGSSGGAADTTPTSATMPTPKVNGFDATAETLCTAFDAYSQGLLFRDPSDDVDLPEERVFIASWVDYYNKYCMGYALTDGSVGVHFNDNTTLVLAADKQYVLISFILVLRRNDSLLQALRLYIVAPARHGVRPQELHRRGLSRRTEEQSVPPETLRELHHGQIIRRLRVHVHGSATYKVHAFRAEISAHETRHCVQVEPRLSTGACVVCRQNLPQLTRPPAVQLLRPLEDHSLGTGPRHRTHRQELRAHALDAKPSDGPRAPPAVFGPRTSQIGTAPVG